MTKIERWIIGRFISPEIREYVVGDFEEISAEAARSSGFLRVRTRLWLDVFRSLPYFTVDRIRRDRKRRAILREDSGREAGRPGRGVLPAACFSLGLACCLTILALTRDYRAENDISGGSPNQNAYLAMPVGHSAISELAIESTSLKGDRKPPSGVYGIPLARARRTLTWEFALMFASALVFINQRKKRARNPFRAAEIGRTTARSIGFSASVAIIAILQTDILSPYFEFLPEKRMLIYWLVSLWLIFGGIVNIMIALVLPRYSRVSRRPRRFRAVYAAFIMAFLVGSFLIICQLDRLKSVMMSETGSQLVSISANHAGNIPGPRPGR